MSKILLTLSASSVLLLGACASTQTAPDGTTVVSTQSSPGPASASSAAQRRAPRWAALSAR
jgi:hypothetical protein